MSDTTETRLAAQLKKNKALESDLSKAVKRANAATRESEQLSKELSNANTSRDKLAVLCKTLKAQLSEALAGQAAMEAKAAADAEKVSATIAAVQEQIAASVTSSEKLTGAVQEENASLRDRLTKLADAAGAADSASRQQLELRDAELAQACEQIETLKSALAKHDSVTEQAMAAANAALKREADAKVEVAALKSQVKESTTVIGQVRTQLSQLVSLRTELTECKEGSLRKEKALLETALELQHTRAALAKAQKQRDALQSLCQTLRAQAPDDVTGDVSGDVETAIPPSEEPSQTVDSSSA